MLNGIINIRASVDNSVFEEITVNSGKVNVSGNSITINPAGTFTPLASYYLQFDGAAIKDTEGNFMSSISNTSTIPAGNSARFEFTAETISCPVANVANSNYSTAGSINLDFPNSATVVCDDGYLSGGNVTCQINGALTSTSLCNNCDTANNYEDKGGEFVAV